MSAPSDYDQGYQSGMAYARDCRRKRRSLPVGGRDLDLVELAADQAYWPPDLTEQLEERVPAHARPEFLRGFRDGVRAFLNAQPLGLGDN